MDEIKTFKFGRAKGIIIEKFIDEQYLKQHIKYCKIAHKDEVEYLEVLEKRLKELKVW